MTTDGNEPPPKGEMWPDFEDQTPDLRTGEFLALIAMLAVVAFVLTLIGLNSFS